MNYDRMKEILESSVGTKLYNHCLSTMEEAGKLARIYGVDEEKAKIAGLLHDCGKSNNKEENDNLTHAGTSAMLARSVYNIDDEEIINAILYHTTGRENMTILEKIIFIADKIEPNRHYEGVEDLRRIAYNNIDDALINALESTIEYVKRRNQELNIESINTLRFLKEKK
ncbi:MAG: bis(5'-nucleosyl)-tetraphosphatase (symmetrical) YqeK [Sedimentibacter sp.]|uniref:bis(5'-nucleosyl)-tetraphosphatase (symmetrical) YqeK n=1 Tax=Sedimentibacter sp. TaxID=1960295 RepID=UPI002981C5A0|nr:bis(5'-nucleosyl)-tetraphosphatase (symmetrical) YqeK [Sedimentibacter sp.]MDW5300557.1 bis(5'-nucleosyl)-tetraphosphatase (symmetrical) YqeK [Sedimentibacter sp.]